MPRKTHLPLSAAQTAVAIAAAFEQTIQLTRTCGLCATEIDITIGDAVMWAKSELRALPNVGRDATRPIITDIYHSECLAKFHLNCGLVSFGPNTGQAVSGQPAPEQTVLSASNEKEIPPAEVAQRYINETRHLESYTDRFERLGKRIRFVERVEAPAAEPEDS